MLREFRISVLFVEMSKLLRELCILKRGASVIPRRVVSAFKKYAVNRVSVFSGQRVVDVIDTVLCFKKLNIGFQVFV